MVDLIMDKYDGDFREIVRHIERKEILLPDFQRKFVWSDEERQKKLVASVLAKMPIGSILLLSSKPDEYLSKEIGTNKTINTKNIKGDVKFLLDGQQRVTVLTNVFSNAIHASCQKVSELASPSLKRRFFLKIPKWKNCKSEEDLFGVHNLTFKYQNPDSEEPDFLTGNIYPFIVVETFGARDDKPYNPKNGLSTKLDDFCLSSDNEGYLIPLFLIIPLEDKSRTQTFLRYNTITKRIAESIKDEILNDYAALTDSADKALFIDQIFDDDDKREGIKNNKISMQTELEELAEMWTSCLRVYLESCIRQVGLNQIVVSEKQRGRAIDIYENLNRGGISLSAFDLIMAKVAIVSNKNFYDRIVENINAKNKYPSSVIPNSLKVIYNKDNFKDKYNASLRTGCYSEEKNDISGAYIDAFLNILSLYCNTNELRTDEFKVEYMKRDKILQLEPSEINNNCEKVCIAIDRALFFFQMRCGIRNIQQINYSLMIVLVAIVFMDDNWFEDISVHNLLEAWYWCTVFSGTYDKDQNVRMISNLQQIIRNLQGDQNLGWLQSIRNDVLNAKFFSNKEFLLMENADVERIPKIVMRSFMCEYLLSQTYIDMFDEKLTISIFMDNADELEAHHIIPLGTAKNFGESSKELRKDASSIYNSPLNFVYITRSANKIISDSNLSDYISKITKQAKSKLHISSYQLPTNENEAKGLLSNRFDDLLGDIKAHIDELMQ